VSEWQLALVSLDEPGQEVELVDGELAEASVSASVLSPPPPPAPSGLGEHNLFAEAERIAARAASASTRRQYAAIFPSFGDWLAGQLGRPPLVGDLDADVIAGYGRHLALAGGRGGRPAAPATARVYLSMLRALARELGLAEEVDGVRIPRHEPGPPETLTDVDYANLLRVPTDRRTLAGKRDYGLLCVLGDCGLRSAELRGLRARDLRRPRTNARHYRLYGRGKGGREREVPVPEAVQQALEAWTAVHPLARGVALLDEQPLFAWCAGRAWPLACPSGSHTRTRCAPIGPPICWRPAFRCTRSRPGSGTSICAPRPAMPRRVPSVLRGRRRA
jgi:hypothetical protein